MRTRRTFSAACCVRLTCAGLSGIQLSATTILAHPRAHFRSVDVTAMEIVTEAHDTTATACAEWLVAACEPWCNFSATSHATKALGHIVGFVFLHVLEFLQALF